MGLLHPVELRVQIKLFEFFGDCHCLLGEAPSKTASPLIEDIDFLVNAVVVVVTARAFIVQNARLRIVEIADLHCLVPRLQDPLDGVRLVAILFDFADLPEAIVEE